MLFVLINWIYVLMTVFCLGIGVSLFSGKVLHYELKRMDSVLAAGWIAATVYVQIFSLFYRVELAANVVLLVYCAIMLLCFHKRVWEFVKRCLCGISWGRRAVILALILLWAYCTSRGYMHYDSDLYHAQSIRWIEEYGIVKGLGNLHERFAYNSSFFALSALYSMRFLLGQSLHTLSGFVALMLSITTLDLAGSWRRKRLSLSDFARVAAVYYLTTITNEVVSPASDYCIMCFIFFIVIKWLDALEAPEEESGQTAPYALLCVAGVYAMTVKLTAGLILLLLIKPAFLLLKEKRWREIGIYLSMGLIVAIPWFARTVIISGWLLYPFPALDLFSFDWKMNAEAARVDAANIKTWGRALYNAALVDVPAWQWFPGWFRTTLSGTEKLLILGDFVSIVVVAVSGVACLVRRSKKQLEVLLVLFTLLCSYVFWQLSAPLVRYGYAYVLLLAALTAGWLTGFIKKRIVGQVLYFAVLLYGVYKLYITADYVLEVRMQPYYVRQQEYGTYELATYEVSGVTFYRPVTGDRTGYEFFPAAPTQANFEFRGEDMEDGFRIKQ